MFIKDKIVDYYVNKSLNYYKVFKTPSLQGVPLRRRGSPIRRALLLSNRFAFASLPP